MKRKSLISLWIILGCVVFSSAVFAQNEEKVTVRDKNYQANIGNLKFKSFGLGFPGITINSVMTDTVFMLNGWGKVMTLSVEDAPDYITYKLIPETLNPNAEGKLIITYDAKKKNEYGRVVDHLNLITNDTVKSKKRIIISPDIMPDFSTLTEQERSNPPVIVFDSTEMNFGKLKEGDVATIKFPFKNTGKRTLNIYSTKASCGCTKAETSVKTVEPGQSGVITVTFDSKRKKGEQSYHVTVISNDIKSPSKMIAIKGMVEQVPK
ncbi:MAG: DUF1573 domain-containing protein [Bacteroidetes bacterium]|nr:DUF1573 domain-containing protein [Bacteroidota bacterium]